MYTLCDPSDEQKLIVNSVFENNVIVNAVAGSGKTTTVLHISKTYAARKILLLTYNRKLRLETKEKAETLELKNLEVHTYHSYGYRYYDKEAATDKGLNLILDKNIQTKNETKYDIVILDEAQDITPTLFKFAKKVYLDSSVGGQLCIFGDVHQSIYDFNDADCRFLKYGDMIFNWNNHPFQQLQLNTSYRLTDNMAGFMNKCVLTDRTINTTKPGQKITYLITNIFEEKRNKIKQCINEYLAKGYQFEDIFVLAPSVKMVGSRGGDTPINILSNMLTVQGIPIYVPSNDDEKLDDDVLRGKLVFSTFHQAKGLERLVVIVYGFDMSYFKFYKKDSNPNICPNELYVALTRAKERLTIVHNESELHPTFLRKSIMGNYCNVEGHVKVRRDHLSSLNIKISVTDFLRHLPQDVVTQAMGFLKIKTLCKEGTKINIPIKTKQGHLYESVSEITGTAIPAYFEYVTKGIMSIYTPESRSMKNGKLLPNESENNDDGDKEEPPSSYTFDDGDDNDIPQDVLNDIGSSGDIIKTKTKITNVVLHDKITPSELLFLANQYCSERTNIIFKLNQIVDYDWLSTENLDLAVQVLRTQISDKAIYEKKIMIKTGDIPNFEYPGYEFSGAVDVIDSLNVWELKCTENLTDTHKLQLAIYMFIHQHENNNKKVDINDNVVRHIIQKDQLEYRQTVFLIHKNKKYRGILTMVSATKKSIILEIATTDFLTTGQVEVEINNVSYKSFTLKSAKKIEPGKISVCLGYQHLLTKAQYDKFVAKNNKRLVYKYKLFNILTGQILSISAELGVLTEMIKFLIESKYNAKIRLVDSEFINLMSSYHI